MTDTATITTPTLQEITSFVVDMKGWGTRPIAVLSQSAEEPAWQAKLAKKELDRRVKLSTKIGKLV